MNSFHIACLPWIGAGFPGAGRSRQDKDKSRKAHRAVCDDGGDPRVSPAVAIASHAAPSRRWRRAARAGGAQPAQPGNPPWESPGRAGTALPGADTLRRSRGRSGRAEQLSDLEYSDDSPGDPAEVPTVRDRRRKPGGGVYSTADLPSVAGRHCHHCYELGARDWSIWTWPKSNCEQASRVRVPYRCRSWRCPVCRIQESHVLFSRMRDAMVPLSTDGWCLFVLTIDRCGTFSGVKPFTSQGAAFRGLQKMSQRFFEELRRAMKRMGWAPLKSQWVGTVEAHRSGWPHVNFVVWSPELAEWLREDSAERSREGMSSRDCSLVTRWLQDVVTRSGWGLQSTAESARSSEAVASYIVKLAGEQDQTIGEVAKLCQLPLNAPLRFRRIRSGRGFLPPRVKNPEYTGTLLRRTWLYGTPQVLKVHQLKDERARLVQDEVAAWEGTQYENDLSEAYRLRLAGKASRVKWVGLPPLTHWKDGKRLERFVGGRINANTDCVRNEPNRRRETIPRTSCGDPPAVARSSVVGWGVGGGQGSLYDGCDDTS